MADLDPRDTTETDSRGAAPEKTRRRPYVKPVLKTEDLFERKMLACGDPTFLAACGDPEPQS